MRISTTSILAAVCLLAPSVTTAKPFNGFKVVSGLIRITMLDEKSVILKRGKKVPQTKKDGGIIVEILSDTAILNASGMSRITARMGAKFEIASYRTTGLAAKSESASTTLGYIAGEPPLVIFGSKRISVERGEILYKSRDKANSSVYAKNKNSIATVREGKETLRLNGNDWKSNFIEDAPVNFQRDPPVKLNP